MRRSKAIRFGIFRYVRLFAHIIPKFLRVKLEKVTFQDRHIFESKLSQTRHHSESTLTRLKHIFDSIYSSLLNMNPPNCTIKWSSNQQKYKLVFESDNWVTQPEFPFFRSSQPWVTGLGDLFWPDRQSRPPSVWTHSFTVRRRARRWPWPVTRRPSRGPSTTGRIVATCCSAHRTSTASKTWSTATEPRQWQCRGYNSDHVLGWGFT